MAPETRSRGVPPPSRIYHSTPALQQAQFSSQRKVIRRYGKQSGGARAGESSLASLRQQTLTQLDFVSSFEDDDHVVLSDSEGEPASGGDKENVRPAENENDDGEPVPSGRKRRAASAREKRDAKRRRTLGDEPANRPTSKEDKVGRRKTLDDAPSSSYHTQTLTQFLGHRTLIEDSEDEADPGFDNWLGEPTSPSPQTRHGRPIQAKGSQPSPSRSRPRGALKHTQVASRPSREVSLIPQTPAKHIRFEIPSSSQTTATPSMAMIGRYPAPDSAAEISPLGERGVSRAATKLDKLTGRPGAKKTTLVVEDSFATEASGSAHGTPTTTPEKHDLVRDRGMEVHSTKRQPLRETVDHMSPAHVMEDQMSSRKRVDSSPKETPTNRYEIPDSDEEEEDDLPASEAYDDFVAGPETQMALKEVASSNLPGSSKSTVPLHELARQAPPSSPSPSVSYQEPELFSDAQRPSSATTIPAQTTPLQQSSRRPKTIRQPLHPPSSPTTAHTQPIESQRVPLHVLQSLPAASVRTDIVLPISRSALSSLTAGHRVCLELPFKIPTQVSRFWLLEDSMVRFMACIEAVAEMDHARWSYAVSQIFELNNPVEEEDLRAEFVSIDIGRYTYVPPAVASQWMYNLRQAIFEGTCDLPVESWNKAAKSPNRDSTGQAAGVVAKRPTPASSFSVSQQVEAQLKSDIAQATQLPASDDLVPSTPDEARPNPMQGPSSPAARQTVAMAPAVSPHPPSAGTPSNRRTRNPIPPSQATTVSQASTFEGRQSQVLHPQLHTSLSSTAFPPTLPPPSSSQAFLSESNSSASLIPPSYGNFPPMSSPILTRSQMLPDSLIRDDMRAPPPVWDSQLEADKEAENKAGANK